MQNTVTIVVPVYNEAGQIRPLIRALEDVLAPLPVIFDVVFVDDGSTDASADEIRAVATEAKLPVRLIALSRNFGKEAALTAGIEHATGDAVIPMDADLQDPPELIPKFVEKWRQGHKVVYGRRTDRLQDTWLKRKTSSAFYRLFNMVSNIDIPPDVGDFRLIDRSVVAVLGEYRERNRFMKGLFSAAGFKAAYVDYARPKRRIGSSKWNYWKLWNFALDGIFGFSTAPLRVWTYIGLVIATLSFLYATYIVCDTLVFGNPTPGYASLVTIVLFMGGVQLISLGVLGEYIARVFIEVKHRPIYTVDDDRSTRPARPDAAPEGDKP